MMLVEEGKIRLTDPVGRFIPELQNLKVTVLNTDGVIAAAPSDADCGAAAEAASWMRRARLRSAICSRIPPG